MDFLILADKNGVVDMTHESIARRTNRPIDLIRQTIASLEGPDPKSRTPDEQGARIYRLDQHRDWGWGIVNYQYYRNLATQEQRREKTRLRVAKHRKEKEKKKMKGTLGEALHVRNAALRTVTCNASPSASASAYLEELKRNHLYAGIQIERELEKARQWCRKKGRRLTQRFFENWLSKADRVIDSPPLKPKYLPPPREPTEAELEAQRKIVREASEKLKTQLNR